MLSAVIISRKRRRVAIRKSERREALRNRGLLHLQAVLVGSGQKPDIESVEPLKPSHRVSHHGGVGMADVRYAVRIEDRRRDKVGVALGNRRRLGTASRLRARRGWPSRV